MAKLSPFVLKFFVGVFLLLGGLGYGAYKLYGNVLTKSFYYKFSTSELLGKLEGVEMDRVGSDVKIAFPERDSLWHFPTYNKKNPAKSRFTLADYSGNEIATDQPFNELPKYLQQLFRRLGETGVRRIRSEEGVLVFNIADGHRLVYSPAGGFSTLSDLPMIESVDEAKIMDDNWFTYRQIAVQP